MLPNSPLLSVHHRDTLWLRRADRAFTLTELLVVIALVGLMSGIAVMALRSPLGDVRTGSDTISGVLALARTHAMAQNTTALVEFEREGNEDLRIEVHALVDPARPADGTNLMSLNKPIRLRGLSLGDPETGDGALRVTAPGQMFFNSRGEAKVSKDSSPARLFEITLVPSRKPESDDRVSVRVAGLTGRVEVVRP